MSTTFLIGVTSAILGASGAAFIIFLARLIYNAVTGNIKNDKEFNRVMRSSMQAMLQVELRREYNEYYENKKYISMAEKQDFEYIWKCYHALGKYDPEQMGNEGVMDECYDRIMSLPTSKPNRKPHGINRD